MNSKENLPMMLSANEIRTMGFTRKFIQRDKFFEWLDSRETSKDEKTKGRNER